MKSYREKFQTKLDEEISAFREGVLALSGQEIYDNAYKICFYEFMYYDFVDDEILEYIVIKEAKGGVDRLRFLSGIHIAIIFTDLTDTEILPTSIIPILSI